MAKKTPERGDLVFLPEVKPPVDFIIVEKKEGLPDAVKFQNDQFIANLKKAGLTVEPVEGVLYTKFNFIKIKASDDTIKRAAGVHGFFPTFQLDKTMPQYNRKFRHFKTPISLKPVLQDPMFQRCSNSVRGEENTTYTSAERIRLVSLIMEKVAYGSLPDEHGLENLLERKNFVDAYPLHDGPAEWSDQGPLNDRQILAKYWANWRLFYKFQPIHIVYKYYGPEVAFFFEWLEFYTKALLIPLIAGIIVGIIGLCQLFTAPPPRVKEICNSKMQICPECTFAQCYYNDIDEYCSVAKLSFFLDNNYTIGLGVFTTIWGTIVHELWCRRESVLAYKWNMHRSSKEVEEMPNYKERVKNHKRFNKYTQTEEYYTPLFQKYMRFLISSVVVFICILAVIVTDTLICISEHWVEYSIHKYNISWAVNWSDTIVKMYSAFTTVLLIQLYAPRLDKIAEKLTDREIHRTREQYLNSFLFKSYILNFVNTYLMLIYIAYFKDVNYTNPSDQLDYNEVYGIASDVCAPAVGCVSDLSTYLTFCFLRDYIITFVINIYYLLNIVSTFRKIRNIRRRKKKEEIPQWEEEYSLMPASPLFFAESFMMIVLEFGLIMFFIAPVPFLPILAFINNIIELRVTAYSLVKKTRRNVAKQVYGIAGWRTVIFVLIRICFFMSGSVIGFTSTFVDRMVYYFENDGNMDGFVNKSVSSFFVADYYDEMKNKLREKSPEVEVCYYPGQKNPHNSTHPYEHSDRYYQLNGIRLLTIVIYMHLVYFANSIISFLIPKVPSDIRDGLAYDELLKKTGKAKDKTGKV